MGVELNEKMAGPYLRAIQSGLRALAPNDEQVPLSPLMSHLRAMDPAHTADLFAPFTVDAGSGLPDYTWLERVRSELKALGPHAELGWDLEEIERAAQLEPALGRRMRARQWLKGQGRQLATLPNSFLQLHFRHRGERERVLLQLDKMVPTQGWVRLKMDMEGPKGWGADLWVETGNGVLHPAEGLLHLCSRHIQTPLALLHHTLERQLEVWIPSISRGIIGPFWYPGGPNLDAPPIFDGALALHVALERLSTDCAGNRHRDPWLPPVNSEIIPTGYGIFRGRRFAVSGSHLSHIRQWSDEQGYGVIVVPIESL